MSRMNAAKQHAYNRKVRVYTVCTRAPWVTLACFTTKTAAKRYAREMRTRKA